MNNYNKLKTLTIPVSLLLVKIECLSVYVSCMHYCTANPNAKNLRSYWAHLCDGFRYTIPHLPWGGGGIYHIHTSLICISFPTFLTWLTLLWKAWHLKKNRCSCISIQCVNVPFDLWTGFPNEVELLGRGKFYGGRGVHGGIF